MVRDVRLDAADGLVVLGWHISENGLFLVARDQDEIRLQCICGRCHWIVHQHLEANRAELFVTCHHCGQRRAFVVEGARLRAP